jgi:hypothetical protein
MPTITAGSVATVYAALDTTLAITPGTAGRVSVNGRNTVTGASVTPREIYSATTITLVPGDQVSIEAVNTDATYTGNVVITTPGGGVVGLSEVTPEVLANPTATTTVLSGAGIYYGYRCTTATGNITVYDNTAASGKVLVPTTALALGSFPIFGAGNPRGLQVATGVTVVLSGAGVVYAGVEAA